MCAIIGDMRKFNFRVLHRIVVSVALLLVMWYVFSQSPPPSAPKHIHQATLMDKLRNTIVKTGIKFVYVLHDRDYVLEHLIPLAVMFPGHIVHSAPLKDNVKSALRKLSLTIAQKTSDEIKRMATDGKHILIACTGNAVGWWERGHMPIYSHTITLQHGIDDDAFYDDWKDTDKQTFGFGNVPQYIIPYPSLLWTSKAEWIRHTIGTTRKTLIDKLTVHPNFNVAGINVVIHKCWDAFASKRKYKCIDLTSEISKLKHEYGDSINILLVNSPHLKVKPEIAINLDSLNIMLSSIMLIEAADILVSGFGGILSASTRTPDKKTLLLNDHGDRQKLNNANSVMNSKTTHVLYKPNELVPMIKNLMAHEPIHKANKELYFKRRYGCIDGLEEFRVLILILQDVLKLDMRELINMYANTQGAKCPVEHFKFYHKTV